MKFKKVMSGWYKSERGGYEITKYGNLWEVYNTEEEQELYKCSVHIGFTKKYIGSAYSLTEAKAMCK